MLLRLFGADVGKNVNIFPSVSIFAPWQFSIGDDSSIGFNALIYNLGPITIGSRVTVSQRVHLCAGTHEYENPTLPLVKAPITVKDEVWVCADSFVGPGVVLNEGAVVAAGAVVVRNVEAWNVVGGNPAKCIKIREIHP
jgi:putative colanic acid biosynthesis acetyltransferase WcaF